MFLSMGMQLLIKSPILAAWAILKILNKSWEWTTLTGSMVGFILLYIAIMISFVIPKFITLY